MAVPGLIPAERSALCGMSSSFLKVRGLWESVAQFYGWGVVHM
jgi:hypothetical protein